MYVLIHEPNEEEKERRWNRKIRFSERFPQQRMVFGKWICDMLCCVVYSSLKCIEISILIASWHDKILHLFIFLFPYPPFTPSRTSSITSSHILSSSSSSKITYINGTNRDQWKRKNQVLLIKEDGETWMWCIVPGHDLCLYVYIIIKMDWKKEFL